MKKKLKKRKEVVAELKRLLKDKTILGMYKWVKEHADYLVWFENYNEHAIAKIMDVYGRMIDLFDKYNTEEARNDCLNFSVMTVIEMEMNCK